MRRGRSSGGRRAACRWRSDRRGREYMDRARIVKVSISAACVVIVLVAFIVGRTSAGSPTSTAASTPTVTATPFPTPTPYPTLVPLPTLPPMPTPVPTTAPTAAPPLGWSASGDTTTGMFFDANSAVWTFSWTCTPESDAHGSLAVRVLVEASTTTYDNGLKTCDGTTWTWNLGNVGRVAI